MDILFILLALIGVVVVVVLLVGQAKRTEAAWVDVASELGLRLRPGTLFKGRSLAGTHRGSRVHVYTYSKSTGQSSQTYTAYRIRYSSLGLGLKLLRQGPLFKVAHWFGSQDHSVGVPLFDDNVVIQASSRTRVRDFLTPLRRRKILRALNHYKGCKITDHEIAWNGTGAETNPERLKNNIVRLCELARVLTAEDAGGALERGLEEQRAGRLDEALEHAHAAVAETSDPDARVMAGELLLDSGRYAEAVEILEPITQEIDDDEEAAGLVREARRRAEASAVLLAGAPVVPVAAVAVTPEDPAASERESAVPVDAAPAESPADPVDLVPLCDELFERGRMSFEVSRDFDERYAGRPVRWSGELERAESYFSDLAFGSGPGTRAVLLIHEMDEDAYGGREVKAVVQLPASALEGLKSRRGERFTLTGRLVRCDSFMRNLFVADGTLED